MRRAQLSEADIAAGVVWGQPVAVQAQVVLGYTVSPISHRLLEGLNTKITEAVDELEKQTATFDLRQQRIGRGFGIADQEVQQKFEQDRKYATALKEARRLQALLAKNICLVALNSLSYMVKEESSQFFELSPDSLYAQVIQANPHYLFEALKNLPNAEQRSAQLQRLWQSPLFAPMILSRVYDTSDTSENTKSLRDAYQESEFLTNLAELPQYAGVRAELAKDTALSQHLIQRSAEVEAATPRTRGMLAARFPLGYQAFIRSTKRTGLLGRTWYSPAARQDAQAIEEGIAIAAAELMPLSQETTEKKSLGTRILNWFSRQASAFRLFFGLGLEPAVNKLARLQVPYDAQQAAEIAEREAQELAKRESDRLRGKLIAQLEPEIKFESEQRKADAKRAARKAAKLVARQVVEEVVGNTVEYAEAQEASARKAAELAAREVAVEAERTRAVCLQAIAALRTDIKELDTQIHGLETAYQGTYSTNLHRDETSTIGGDSSVPSSPVKPSGITVGLLGVAGDSSPLRSPSRNVVEADAESDGQCSIGGDASPARRLPSIATGQSALPRTAAVAASPLPAVVVRPSTPVSGLSGMGGAASQPQTPVSKFDGVGGEASPLAHQSALGSAPYSDDASLGNVAGDASPLPTPVAEVVIAGDTLSKLAFDYQAKVLSVERQIDSLEAKELRELSGLDEEQRLLEELKSCKVAYATALQHLPQPSVFQRAAGQITRPRAQFSPGLGAGLSPQTQATEVASAGLGGSASPQTQAVTAVAAAGLLSPNSRGTQGSRRTNRSCARALTFDAPLASPPPVCAI